MMASYPPPPPNGSYPPQNPDPRWQQRYWKEQRRAQRAQSRQLRYQMRSLRRGSILTPVLLIGTGIVLLLLHTGQIDRGAFYGWYGHWWPLLLIAAGVVVLAEWALDQRAMRDPGAPQYRRTYFGACALLLLLGVGSLFAGPRGPGRGAPGGPRPGFGFFGLPTDQNSFDEMFGDKHESEQTMDAAFPQGSSLSVVNPRGDVTVRGTSTDDAIHIVLHKEVFARSDSDAESKAQQLALKVEQPTGSGGAVEVKLPSIDGARGNLEITVPSSAATTVVANRGDVHIGSIRSDVTVTSNNGDIELTGVTGQATAHINSGRASVSAHSIGGGITVEGRGQDLTLADITGPVNISGDFFGTTNFARLNGAIKYHTSRSDFNAARLDGQAEIQRDSDISADQVMGPLLVNTRNGNVTLNRVAGDITVTNRNGSIDLTAAPALGNISAEDRNGSLRVTLPTGSGFSVEAATTDGNVESEFDLSTANQKSDKVLRGLVGTGGPTVRLTTREGDITIRKADVEPLPATAPAPAAITLEPAGKKPAAAPAAPAAPKPPRSPRAPKAPDPDEAK